MDVLSAMGVFVRVVDLKSFSLAAAELGISSSSVSKQIAHLEQHVGARLLQRTTRRLSVTEVGSAYHEKCQLILAEVGEAENLVSQLQGKPQGILKINCNMTFGQLLLSKAIPEFMKLYPDIQFEVALDDGDVELLKEGFDLALRITNPKLPDSSLIAREIASIPLFLCASPRYLAEHGEPQTPEELKQHNCLVFMLATNTNIWTLSNAAGSQVVQVSGDLKANNSLLVLQSVLADRGVANLASFVIQPYVEAGRIELLLPDYEAERLSLYAVYPDRKYMPPKVSLFIEFFQRWLDENLQQTLG
ncbi:LysR family transcriptional regulator [Amphritea sp. 2_MG-2023]|jgi:DNA-binding transcriptional LysR family regulator|uniref:LysR family transcriptional regulator n=1 Tax=Amphritea TaxID=515417 RepID=UPI001C076850|nr:MULTISPECIES: LysR family transcriptional regulator [Amphritea]MBU2966572.1 LysR family transcriptional regulator [Amphritea atlantica]MDO6417569.1 LysR family transcriptional regulator [Amphritea sp. 2_MG-2023]MDX2424327.1 LysR family transcriptional regulator [Amphritea sp.]